MSLDSLREEEKQLKELFGVEVDENKRDVIDNSRIRDKSVDYLAEVLMASRLLNDVVFGVSFSLLDIDEERELYYKVPCMMALQIARNERTHRDLIVKADYEVADLVLRTLLEQMSTINYIIREDCVKDWKKYQVHRSSLMASEIESPYRDQEAIPKAFSKFETMLEELGMDELYNIYRRLSMEAHPSLVGAFNAVNLVNPVNDDDEGVQYEIEHLKQFDRERATDRLYMGVFMLFQTVNALNDLISQHQFDEQLPYDISSCEEVAHSIYVSAKMVADRNLP